MWFLFISIFSAYLEKAVQEEGLCFVQTGSEARCSEVEEAVVQSQTRRVPAPVAVQSLAAAQTIRDSLGTQEVCLT